MIKQLIKILFYIFWILFSIYWFYINLQDITFNYFWVYYIWTFIYFLFKIVFFIKSINNYKKEYFHNSIKADIFITIFLLLINIIFLINYENKLVYWVIEVIFLINLFFLLYKKQKINFIFYKKISNYKKINLFLFVTSLSIFTIILITWSYFYIDNKIYIIKNDYKIEINKQEYKKLYDDINLDNILNNYKNLDDYFLIASSLSNSQINEIENIYLKTKWKIIFEKNKKYNYENFDNISNIYLLLWNYYIIHHNTNKSKEIYIDLIQKNNQILENLDYNWLTAYIKSINNILKDIEVNKNIFNIREIRQIIFNIKKIDTKNVLFIVFNDYYNNIYSNIKHLPSIPLIFDKNIFLKKLEYNYDYQIENNWMKYFKKDDINFYKSNLILNIILVNLTNDFEEYNILKTIEENIIKLKSIF